MNYNQELRGVRIACEFQGCPLSPPVHMFHRKFFIENTSASILIFLGMKNHLRPNNGHSDENEHLVI